MELKTVFEKYKSEKKQLEVDMAHLQREFSEDVEDQCEHQDMDLVTGDPICKMLSKGDLFEEEVSYCSLNNCPFVR